VYTSREPAGAAKLIRMILSWSLGVFTSVVGSLFMNEHELSVVSTTKSISTFRPEDVHMNSSVYNIDDVIALSMAWIGKYVQPRPSATSEYLIVKEIRFVIRRLL